MRLSRTIATIFAGLLLNQGLQAEMQIKRDIAYGNEPEQRFDVYAPAQAKGAPVILMVHGGGWRRGDKDASRIVENKTKRWVPKGFVFVTVNYRMLPKIGPLDQAGDAARALAHAQKIAGSFGGDSQRFILMGHSAGAHLIALLATRPELAAQAGATPWLGTILLDSGALDVPAIMNARHFRLYDQAFGSDPAYWRAASPFHQLNGTLSPVLAVCSARRSDSCQQAQNFVAKAGSYKTRATVMEENLSHGEINERLGEDIPYTLAVESFMKTLDPLVARMLSEP